MFEIRDPQLLKYYHAFERLRGNFEEVQVIHISREVNDKADKLARLETSPKLGQLKTFILLSVPEPSVLGKEVLQVKEGPSGWKKEILEYLKHETLSADKGKARKLKAQAAKYTLVAGELYRRGFSFVATYPSKGGRRAESPPTFI